TIDLQRKEDGRPGQNRGGEVEGGQERHDCVDAPQVERHAERDRDQLDGRQSRTGPEDAHYRADDRMGFNCRTPRAHAEVGEHAVQALDADEGDYRKIAKTRPGRVPRPLQFAHRTVIASKRMPAADAQREISNTRSPPKLASSRAACRLSQSLTSAPWPSA